jgi:hypothetical protein
MSLVYLTGLLMFPIPLMVSMRSFAEGVAAVRKRPGAVLTGEIAYLGLTAAISLMLLFGGAQGYVIGALGRTIGNAAAFGMVLLYLQWSRLPIRRAVAFLSLRQE